ncbi:hypothetical protein K9L05_04225 [Candidatus Babeliales bacterium]|nr:hypothetical protein [Candidatus Babeliales bacterium]MCF7899819.1 hypothetical protein [Candidatus Babeliales bacterium]
MRIKFLLNKASIRMVCFFLLLIFNFVNLKPEIKKSEEVFEKFIKIQHCINDINIGNMKKDFNDENIMVLKSRYVTILNFLETFDCFCGFTQEKNLKNSLFELEIPKDQDVKAKFFKLYDLLEKDISKFIDYLKDVDFIKELKDINNFRVTDSMQIEEAKDMINLLFYNKDFLKTEKYLFGVANKFFEYFFSEKTNKDFELMLKDSKSHAIIKFMYSIIWFHLAGNGWKNWHQNSLKNLKQKCDLGHEIVYIAGGSDIYQLIKSGIYNIRLIDPILPSQPKYYTDKWDWLVVGGTRNADPEKDMKSDNWGKDDQIIFNFEDKNKQKIIMQRESFQEFEQTIQTRISTGKIIDIPKSTTTWKFYFADNSGKITNQKPIGSFTIERRFAEQGDFEIQNNKTLLISFNELYFITVPVGRGGWGINPLKFDDNLQIYVKQLKNPVDANITRNMRRAFDQLEFNYIALGTCVD